jgi:hypothetical protein
MAVYEWLQKQEPDICCRGIWNLCQCRQMHDCAKGLRWKVMTLQGSKCGTFNIVMMSYWIFMTLGFLLVETSFMCVYFFVGVIVYWVSLVQYMQYCGTTSDV